MFKIISILVLLSSSRSWASDGPLVQLASRGLATAPKIHVNVNMVLVPVSVMDIYGRSVIGLQRESFAVFDDSHRVPIVSFARQDQPVTVGLIFDCSSSMQEKFGTAREAPRQLFQQLNPKDESFLITVSDKAELKQALTSNFEELQNALVFTAPRGRTSLLDGVYAGLQHIRTSRNPRKALIIVSDGGDNNSRYTLRELSNMALESDAQIFAAGLYDRPQTEEEKDGPVLLSELCQRTGGANFVIKDRYGLRDAMGKIGVTLHNQYVLGYYPPDEGVDGKYRRIKVQLLVPAGVRPLHVNARTSYHVPEQ
jgi:Ca-activated chloride channel family protein